MERYFLLYPQDTSETVCLLHHEDATGKIVLRTQYNELQCKRCGKLDERTALASGISPDINIRTKTDLFSSYESLYLVSERLRKIIEANPDSNVSFYDIPGSSNVFAALPNRIYRPDPSSPTFRMSKLCPECGRYRSVVWGTTPPIISDACTFGVFCLENRIGMMSVWVLSESALDTLKNATPKLKGLCINPDDVVLLRR